MATNQISAEVSSAGQDCSAFIPTPRHPAQRVAPYGDHSMNNPSIPKNLHPVWQRHFGIQTIQPTKPQAKPLNAGEALMRAVQALAAAHPNTR